MLTLLSHATDWALQHPEATGALVILLITVAAAVVVTLRATGSLRQSLLAAMLQLDRARRHGRLGAIDGPQVMDHVIRWAMAALVPALPIWVRPWVTEERLRTLAQNLFDAGLDYLDDGLLNGTNPIADDGLPPTA